MIVKIVCAGENHFKNLYKKDENEYLIAVDGGLSVISKMNLVADLAIGDFDSCDINEYNCYKEKITYNKIKDESDLELALIHAFNLNFEKIVIYNATCNRLDHFYASILLLNKFSKKNIEIVNNNNKIKVINETTVFKKSEYKYISFFALEEDVVITLEGFYYNIKDYKLETSNPLGLSNEIKEEGKVVINKKKVLVIESF